MAGLFRLLWVLATSAAVLGFNPVQAQQPARGATPALDLPAGRWNVEYGRARCTLNRRIAGEGSPILIVSTKSGRELAEVMLVADRGGGLPRLPSRGQMRLLPAGTAADVRIQPFPGHERRAVRIDGVPLTFLDQLAGASGLHLGARNQTGVTVPTPDAQGAVAAVRACNQDLLRSWGVDVDRQNRMTQVPTQVGGSFSSTDYPEAAMARNQAGTTLVRLTITADGLARDCRVIFTSRVPLLDATTCRVIMSRFRYRPALDERGNPTPFMIVQSVRWGIADDEVDGFFFGTTYALPATGIAN